MARGGRRKVSVYEQQARSNRKFVKAVTKAVLPSKRTQRAVGKLLFSTPKYKKTPRRGVSVYSSSAIWSDMMLSKAQWSACIIIGAFCAFPVFSSGAFDGSGISFFVLFVFFAMPFLAVLLILAEYNKFRRLRGKTSSKRIVETYETYVENIPLQYSSSQEDYGATINAQSEIDRLNAQNFMKQVQDSLQIMQTTANPDTFFSRYDFVLERLNDMIELERKGIKFSGNPVLLLEQAKNEETIADTVNVLIDNSYQKQFQKLSTLKTERGRLNSIERWRSSFEPFFDKMPTKSREYLKLKYAELKDV